MSTAAHEPGEGYAGPATLTTAAGDLAVEVRLRGGFQPIDGRFHWYGRVRGADAVPSGTTVTLRTEHGEASGRLTDLDHWDRYRIGGTGRPPF